MTVLNLQVGASEDDGPEQVNDGVMFLTGNSIAFGNLSVPRHVGIRFTGVSGLSGATVTTGTLTFRADTADTGSFIGDWFAQDAAAPGTFTTANSDISDRTRTTATCEGDGSDFGDWSSGDYTFTGDGSNTIADIIQELADSYDPSTIVLIHIFTSGNGERVFKSYDEDSGTAPKLDIDYTAAAAGGDGTDMPWPDPTLHQPYPTSVGVVASGPQPGLGRS